MRTGAAWVVVAGIAGGLAGGLAAVARGEVVSLASDPASGIKAEAEGWTGLSSAVVGRDVGPIPVTITITNGSPADHVWTVARRETGRQSRNVHPLVRITVAAGATGRATFFVGSDGSHWSMGNIFTVSGFGVDGGFNLDVSPTAQQGDHGTVLATGVSAEAFVAQGSPFAAYTIRGGPLDMTRAPEDWRGWSAFRNVLLTEAEWQGLAGGRRKALLDWAATGGRAGVLVADRDADRLDRIGFPVAGPDGRRRVGAGEILVVPWDGTKLAAADVEAFLDGQQTFAATLTAYRAGEQLGGWDLGFGRLFDVFGPRLLPVVPILTFLAIFGLVAGPLNLMVIAGPRRRSRMFWTTPAISLAATACLLALMFLRDGVGGAGSRRVLGLLVPTQNTMAIVQEQFSRTGVLLGSSFPITEPAWLEPLGNRDQTRDHLEVDGRTRRGDWFGSRSDQAFLAVAVRPSRAGIELVTGADDAAPAVKSSIKVPLDRVFIIDEEGRYWTATDVGTGVEHPLEESDAEAYERWFRVAIGDAGPVRRRTLGALTNLRGHAYASSRAAGELAVPTLGAIRWVDERADFAGPYTRSRRQ